MGIAIPADHRVKLKESNKRDKFLDPVRELKRTMDYEVTVIPIVVGALRTVLKGWVSGVLVLEIRGRAQII